MQRYYDRERMAEKAFIGKVVLSEEGTIQVCGHTQLRKVKMIGLPGVYALPQEGQTVVMLPIDNGGYLMLGNILEADGLNQDEIILKNNKGAYLKLRNDGKIEINGLVISSNGQIEER